MSNGIVVDYMGDGNFMQAFHPFMKVTNVFGAIDVPDISIPATQASHDHPFKLPYPIDNPFLCATHVWGVDCYFVPVNMATGDWIMRMYGHRATQEYMATGQTWVARYPSPCTNTRGLKTQILYGGFRG